MSQVEQALYITWVLERQHWPSDVAAGYLVGALALTAAIVLYHRLGQREAAYCNVCGLRCNFRRHNN